MEKRICIGIMAMVVAACLATMVQPAQSQIESQCQLQEPASSDGDVAETLGSEKLSIKRGKIWGKVKKPDYGQVGACLGNVLSVTGCVDGLREAFTSFPYTGVGKACCDALSGASHDCLAAYFLRSLPQIRFTVAAVSGWCTVIGWMH